MKREFELGNLVRGKEFLEPLVKVLLETSDIDFNLLLVDRDRCLAAWDSYLLVHFEEPYVGVAEVEKGEFLRLFRRPLVDFTTGSSDTSNRVSVETIGFVTSGNDHRDCLCDSVDVTPVRRVLESFPEVGRSRWVRGGEPEDVGC